MPEDDRSTFARNLDDELLRRRREITARDVAAKAGIGETDLSRIRLGKREPSVTLAAKIAAVLGVSLDSLAGVPGTDADP